MLQRSTTTADSSGDCCRTWDLRRASGDGLEIGPPRIRRLGAVADDGFQAAVQRPETAGGTARWECGATAPEEQIDLERLERPSQPVCT